MEQAFDFNTSVTELAQLQAQQAADEAQLAEHESAFAAEHAALIRSIKDRKEQIADKTSALKDRAVQAYTETGVKNLHDAVGIRVYKVAQYDTNAARAWAQEKRPDLIVLDAKGYEKVLKSTARDPEMPGDVIEDPRATLSGDLSAYAPQTANA